jgi:hypothetical protein
VPPQNHGSSGATFIIKVLSFNFGSRPPWIPSDARLISAEFMEHRRILGLQAVVEHATTTGV